MKQKIIVFILALLASMVFVGARITYAAVQCADGTTRNTASECPAPGAATTNNGAQTTTNNAQTSTPSQPLNTNDSNCVTDGNTTQICNPLGKTNLLDLVLFVLNKIFALIGIIAVFVIVIAGFQLVVFASDPKQIENAKGTLKNAIAGLALSALAYIIVAIVENILS